MKSYLRKYSIQLSLIVCLIIGTQLQAQTVVQWYTSMGDFRVELREDLVPMTAQNFIDLTNDEFYDDLIFHRVIANFMIQDGDPTGTGYGGPGYTFDDEFHPDLRHDQPGILSMANSGPNTNGSQYFITVVPTAWLDDVHAVFGKVMDGMEVVYAISEVETNANDKPLIDVVIDSIRVVTGDPEVELTAPVAGGRWNNALENKITWSSAFIGDVKIEFSSDNGQNWTIVEEAVSAHPRSYDWNTPSIISEECLIKISDVRHPDVFSITESPFTLCNLDLTSPNGFDIYQTGREVEVSWSSELVGDLSVYYLSSEGGEWVFVEEGIPASDGMYMWTPEVASDWCKLKISETAYPEVADESEYRFFVYTLDLVSPQSGDIVPPGLDYAINWESEITPNIRIEFSDDGGNNWNYLATSISADEYSFLWSVPNLYLDNCFIKLTAVNAPTVYAINQEAFYILDETGIEGASLNEHKALKVIQNPVSDILKLEFMHQTLGSSDYSLSIFNARGEKMLQEEGVLKGQQNNYLNMDISAWSNGVYFIHFTVDGESWTQSFVKGGK